VQVFWSVPLLKENPASKLDQVFGGLVQTSFQYIQRWRFLSLSMKHVLVLDQHYGEEIFLHTWLEYSTLQHVSIISCHSTLHLWEESGSILFILTHETQFAHKIFSHPSLLKAEQVPSDSLNSKNAFFCSREPKTRHTSPDVIL